MKQLSLAILVALSLVVIPAEGFELDLATSGTNSLTLSWSNSPAPPYRVMVSEDLSSWSNAAEYILPTSHDISFVVPVPTNGETMFYRVEQMETDFFYQGLLTNGVAKNHALTMMADTTNATRTMISLTDTDENGTYDVLSKDQMMVTSSGRVVRVDAVAYDTSTGRQAVAYVDVPGLLTNIGLSYAVATTDDWLTVTNVLTRSNLLHYASNALPSIIPWPTNEFAIEIAKEAATHVDVIDASGSYEVLDPDPVFGALNLETSPRAFLESGKAGVWSEECCACIHVYCPDLQGGNLEDAAGHSYTLYGVEKWIWTWWKLWPYTHGDDKKIAPWGDTSRIPLGELNATIEDLEPGTYSVSIDGLAWVNPERTATRRIDCFEGSIEVVKKVGDCDEGTSPVLAVSSPPITPTIVEGETASAQSIDISNSGTGSLSYRVNTEDTGDGMSWFALDGRLSGTCNDGDAPKSVIVYFPKSHLLPAGTEKSGRIKVDAGDVDGSPQYVDVSLTVTPIPVARYQLIEGSFNWEEANEDAAGRGGHLLTIADDEEADAAVAACGSGSHGYLGGTDEAVEGQWEWVTGEPWNPAVNHHWASGEPNNVGRREHYMNGRIRDWNDVGSNALGNYFLEIE